MIDKFITKAVMVVDLGNDVYECSVNMLIEDQPGHEKEGWYQKTFNLPENLPKEGGDEAFTEINGSDAQTIYPANDEPRIQEKAYYSYEIHERVVKRAEQPEFWEKVR